MGLSDSADLLFKIGADASDATGNMQRFRGVMSKDLAELKTEFSDWSKSVFGDLSTGQGKLQAGMAAGLAGAVALAGAAVSAGRILYQAATAAAEYAGEIDDAGDKTGMSADELSRLRYAGNMLGVSFDTLTAALTKFGQSVAEAQDPTSRQARAFHQLGITQAELKAGMQDLSPVLRRVMDGFAGTESAAAKATLSKTLFKDRTAELVEMLSLGSDKIREFSEEAERMGLVLTDKDLRAAQAFKFQVTELKEAFKGLMITVGQEVLPVLTEFFLRVEAWKSSLAQVRKVYEEQPWWKGLIPAGREAAALREGLTIFDRELAAARERMDNRLKALFGKGSGGSPSPIPTPEKKDFQGFEQLSSILSQVSGRMAGLGGEESKAAYEAAVLRENVSKAAGELQKLKDAGKISSETYHRELAALGQLPAAITTMLQAQFRGFADARREAVEEAGRELLQSIREQGQESYASQAADWDREVDGLTDRFRREQKLTAENQALLDRLRAAGAQKIQRSQQEAFVAELAALQQNLAQMVTARMTSAERIRWQYEQDLERYSQAKEEAAKDKYTDPADREAVATQFEMNRAAAYADYGEQLTELYNSTGWQGVFGNLFAEQIRGNEELLREWAISADQSAMMVRVSLESLRETGRAAFDGLAQGMGRNIASALAYKQNIGEAMKAALAATLATIAAESYVQAIYATALGFVRLAQWDFASAANAFTAAGIFGSVGTAAALAGRVAAPSKSGGSAGPRGAESAGSSSAGSGASSGTAVADTKPSVTIIMNGSIYGKYGVEEFLEVVNDAVQNRDAKLVASDVR
jgi:hypothetical protein